MNEGSPCKKNNQPNKNCIISQRIYFPSNTLVWVEITEKCISQVISSQGRKIIPPKYFLRTRKRKLQNYPLYLLKQNTQAECLLTSLQQFCAHYIFNMPYNLARIFCGFFFCLFFCFLILEQSEPLLSPIWFSNQPNLQTTLTFQPLAWVISLVYLKAIWIMTEFT